MLNDKTIQTIAEAILANTKALQSLIDTLPREAQAAVAAKTVQSNDVAPVAQPPAPVVTQSAPAPAVAAVTVPTLAPAAPVAAPAMPAAPVFAPAPAAPAPAVPAVEVPFSDSNGMTQYVLNVYREIGPQRAAGIQAVIQQLGVTNINDIKPEQYGQLWAGVEAVRKAG
jgi:pyruvate dehydrogenase E2 component (dihydrolipoamide acetyltransferase)